ncbi:hypothetical protein [Novosphingobium resinovorum]|uniref:hypothetical protein n=1 Tax=Novosphingobium resinovorum TaxID=158500 RepID=UPI0012EA6663|nr:hypothetical protein [Novosphingobium resinovorum]
MTNDETAPTRLINGRIYKSADDQRPADALVVLDGKIVWVGDNSDVPSARHTIDLQGATVLPGALFWWRLCREFHNLLDSAATWGSRGP